MHRQLVLQAGKADDLPETWRLRHQVHGGPGLSGVHVHPRERAQATGVARAQAGHTGATSAPIHAPRSVSVPITTSASLAPSPSYSPISSCRGAIPATPSGWQS